MDERTLYALGRAVATPYLLLKHLPTEDDGHDARRTVARTYLGDPRALHDPEHQRAFLRGYWHETRHQWRLYCRALLQEAYGTRTADALPYMHDATWPSLRFERREVVQDTMGHRLALLYVALPPQTPSTPRHLAITLCVYRPSSDPVYHPVLDWHAGPPTALEETLVVTLCRLAPVLYPDFEAGPLGGPCPGCGESDPNALRADESGPYLTCTTCDTVFPDPDA